MTTPIRLSNQNRLFTPKPQRISASLTSANRVLRRYSIPIRLKTLSDCTPTLWIILYETIFDIRIPELKRQANDFAAHVFNLEIILQRLEKEVLEAELPHLKPQLICRGDEDSILDLLEIFVEIVNLLDSQLLNSTKDEEKIEQQTSSSVTTSTISDLSFSSNLSSTQIRQILKKYIDEIAENSSNDSLLESGLKELIHSKASSELPEFDNNLVSSTPVSHSSQLQDTTFLSFLSDGSEIGASSMRNSSDGLYTRFNTSSRVSSAEEQTRPDEETRKDPANKSPNIHSIQSPLPSRIGSSANSQSTDSYILEEIEKLIERAKEGEKISETSKLETILEYLRQEGIDILSSEISSHLSPNETDDESIESVPELRKSYQSSYQAHPKTDRNINKDYTKDNERKKPLADFVSKSMNVPQSSRKRLDSDEGYGTHSRAFSRSYPKRHSDTEKEARQGISSAYSHTHSLHTDGSFTNVSQSKRSTPGSSVADGNVDYDVKDFRILMPERFTPSSNGESFDRSFKDQEPIESESLKSRFEHLRQHYPKEKRMPLRRSGERLKVQDDIEEFLAEHGDDSDGLFRAKSKEWGTSIPSQLLYTPDDSAYVRKLKDRRQKTWLKAKTQERQPKDKLYETLAMNEEYFRKFTHRGDIECQGGSRGAELIKQTRKKIEQESRAAVIKLNQMTKRYAKQSIHDRKSRLARLRKEKDNIDQQALSIETRIQSEESKTLHHLFLTTLKLQKSAIEEGRREQQTDAKQREDLRKENQKALEALLKNQLSDAENEAREERVNSGIKSQMILESLRELQKNQFVHAYEKLNTIKKQTSSSASEFI